MYICIYIYIYICIYIYIYIHYTSIAIDQMQVIAAHRGSFVLPHPIHGFNTSTSSVPSAPEPSSKAAKKPWS